MSDSIILSQSPKIGEVEIEVKEVGREVDREVEKLTKNQRMILDLIRKDPTISKKEMSKIIGIRQSSIDKYIVTLKEKNICKGLVLPKADTGKY